MKKLKRPNFKRCLQKKNALSSKFQTAIDSEKLNKLKKTLRMFLFKFNIFISVISCNSKSNILNFCVTLVVNSNIISSIRVIRNRYENNKSGLILNLPV